jgi:hypothetical protein
MASGHLPGASRREIDKVDFTSLRKLHLSPPLSGRGGECLGDNRKIGFREGSIFVGKISIDLRDLPYELYLSGLPEGRLDRSTDERTSGKAGLAGEPVNPAKERSRQAESDLGNGHCSYPLHTILYRSMNRIVLPVKAL